MCRNKIFTIIMIYNYNYTYIIVYCIVTIFCMSLFWTCLRHGPVRLDGLFSQESGRTVTTTIGEYVEAGRTSMTEIQLVFFIGPHLWKQNQLIQSQFDLLPCFFFDSIGSQISFVENSPRAFWAKKSILVDHYLECRWRHQVAVSTTGIPRCCHWWNDPIGEIFAR